MAAIEKIIVLGDQSEACLQRLSETASDKFSFVFTPSMTDLPEEHFSDARILFIATSPSIEHIRMAVKLLPQLRWVHSKWAGVDKLLSPELIEKDDLVLTNGSGVWSRSLAEFVLTGMLYFAKDVGRLKKSQAARKWDTFNMQTLGRQTVGVVGHGDIGRHIAQRCKALGMTVLALRRDLTARAGDENVDQLYRTEQLNEMIPRCDYIVLSTPLTASTRRMFAAEQFSLMKPSAVFMNVGRGQVVDQQALIDVLGAQKIRGAALDVFEVEPLPADSPLWDFENLLLSAHTADKTETAGEESVDLFLEQLGRWKLSQELHNIVDKRAGY